MSLISDLTNSLSFNVFIIVIIKKKKKSYFLYIYCMEKLRFLPM